MSEHGLSVNLQQLPPIPQYVALTPAIPFPSYGLEK